MKRTCDKCGAEKAGVRMIAWAIYAGTENTKVCFLPEGTDPRSKPAGDCVLPWERIPWLDEPAQKETPPQERLRKDEEYRRRMFTEQNQKERNLKIKYGRDHSNSTTVGELAKDIVLRVLAGDDDERLAEFIDREFLFGCWKHELQDRDPLVLKDLRGLLVECIREAYRKGQ